MSGLQTRDADCGRERHSGTDQLPPLREIAHRRLAAVGLPVCVVTKDMAVFTAVSNRRAETRGLSGNSLQNLQQEEYDEADCVEEHKPKPNTVAGHFFALMDAANRKHPIQADGSQN